MVTCGNSACGAVSDLVARQYYYPYGSVRPVGVGALPTAHTFTGQVADGTGLMYYRARYYDPAVSAFVSADSLVPAPGNPQTLNRYAYALSNPLKYTDPTGHCGFNAVRASAFGSSINFFTCLGNVMNALTASAAGETRPGVLALHATGATDVLVETAQAIDQLNEDVAVTFSNAPLEERLPHAFRLGTFATLTASAVVGTVQLAAGAANGMRGSSGQALIDDVLNNELSGLRLRGPYPRFGSLPEGAPSDAMGASLPNGQGNIIGPNAVQAGRGEVIRTIVHEEMHSRLDLRGWIPRTPEQYRLIERWVWRVEERFARWIGVE